MKRLLALILAVLLLTAATAVAGTTTTATVIGGWLRVRSAASFDAETIASCPEGTVVTVLSTSGSWYFVQLQDGTVGYMYGAYLKLNTTPTSVYVTSANGLPVRMRSGPGTGYSIIGTYAVGTPVTVLTPGDVWDYVQINGQYGYMMAQYLSGSPTAGYTAYVISSNGLSVRLRSGPGTGYGVLGSYSVGTKVTVVNHGTTWDEIKVGSRTGYMMNKYLTTSKPASTTTISGVTLSSYVPTTGQTLTATVSPAGATVSYVWTNDQGAVLSRNPSCTVYDNQIGRKIRLTVTGTGLYSGTITSAYTLAVSSSGSQSYSITGVTINEASPEVGDTLYAQVQPGSATATYAWYRSNGVQLATSQTYTVQSSDIGYKLYCVAIGSGNTTGAAVSNYTNPVTPYGGAASDLVNDLNGLFNE